MKSDLDKVLKFAVNAHDGQLRSGGLPYVVHPIDVMKQLCKWQIQDESIFKAALCHDILEDCPHITFDLLVEEIGQESADIVQELTFIPDKSPDASANHIQKEEYMSKVGDKSVKAMVIKIADRCVNTLDFYDTDLRNNFSKPYAKKYWRKSDILKKKIVERQSEIIDVFGKLTYMMINESCSNINLITSNILYGNEKIREF